MKMNYDILEKLAELAINGQAIKSKALAKSLDHPSKPVKAKSVVGKLKAFEKEGLVCRIINESALLTDGYVAGYWTITIKGCEQMIKDSAGAYIYVAAHDVLSQNQHFTIS